MKSSAVETLIGAAVIAIAAGFFLFAYKTSGVSNAAGGYKLTAEFDNAEGINVGTDVRMAGVKVGTVTGFTLNTDNFQAVVALEVDPKVKLTDDSTAKVTSEGLLGSKFISLEQGGADEMLVRPFTSQALTVRVKAVLENPRPFIESSTYIGPSRRRRMVDDYAGPLRRFIDPTDDVNGAAPWETEPNRLAVRNCVKKISEIASGLTPGDRRKLRDIYAAVQETEALADDTRDALLGAAARSLGRYITAVGAAGVIDPEVISTHIDAMHTLSLLGSAQHMAREKLVEGLVSVVDKKIRRKSA